MKYIINNKIIKKIIIIILLLSMILNIIIPVTVQAVVFDDEITFTQEYISEPGIIPYNLITPSTAKTSGDIPLILWLHGSGEVGKSKDDLLNATHRIVIYFEKLEP